MSLPIPIELASGKHIGFVASSDQLAENGNIVKNVNTKHRYKSLRGIVAISKIFYVKAKQT